MPESRKTMVINTGPIIALIAATGDLKLLQKMEYHVHVPSEVAKEIVADKNKFGVEQFKNASWLRKASTSVDLPDYLYAMLDSGEAAVIQYAIANGISTVCIDETVGRRIARLHGLSVTGSLGILIRARKMNVISSLSGAISKMRKRGIWIHEILEKRALKMAGEQTARR